MVKNHDWYIDIWKHKWNAETNSIINHSFNYTSWFLYSAYWLFSPNYLSFSNNFKFLFADIVCIRSEFKLKIHIKLKFLSYKKLWAWWISFNRWFCQHIALPFIQLNTGRWVTKLRRGILRFPRTRRRNMILLNNSTWNCSSTKRLLQIKFSQYIIFKIYNTFKMGVYDENWQGPSISVLTGPQNDHTLKRIAERIFPDNIHDCISWT